MNRIGKNSVSRYVPTTVIIGGFSFGSRDNEILQRHGVTRSLSRQPPSDMSNKDAILHATHRYHTCCMTVFGARSGSQNSVSGCD